LGWVKGVAHGGSATKAVKRATQLRIAGRLGWVRFKVPKCYWTGTGAGESRCF
jgi:hypothetical protein